MPFAFTCPHCQQQTTVDEQYAGQSGPCKHCGNQVTIPGSLFSDMPEGALPESPSGSQDSDLGIRMLIPVGRSGWAIAAGYLGLFSLLILPGPLAVFCSIMAFRDIRQNPNSHGAGRAALGMLMGVPATLVLLVWLVAALFAA